MIRFDLSALLKRYPDVSHDQLVCLLLLRGDIQKDEAIQMATERRYALFITQISFVCDKQS